MIKKLYIIGNGFDLHHYLKTSYHDFAQYLSVNYQDIYDSLERYISYPNSEITLWSRFEENLANLDVKEILFEHSYTLPDYTSDEFRERDRFVFPDIMEEHHQKLTSSLFSAFEKFIQQVVYLTYSWEQKIILDKEATFLTFNYTNTLERIYNIDSDKILYIHNSAFYGSHGIILGHGVNPETFEEKRPEPPNGLDPKQFEEWFNLNDDYDYSFDEGKQNLMRYFKDTYKPINKIINKHFNFFQKLKDVEDIYILGHSMSSVDLPYFEQIVKNVNKTVLWTVSYYNSDEYKRHLATLKNFKIEEKNIILVELKDLKEKNRQLKIEFNFETK